MPKPTKEFKRKLNRAIRLFIRETMDGCVDCLTNKRHGRGGACDIHDRLFGDVIVNPRKYIKL